MLQFNALRPDTLDVLKVKTDLVYFPKKNMRPIIVQDGVRLLSVDDIAAMKLNAIANRGAKKDFYDLFFLLEIYSVEKLIDLFKEKFESQDVFGLARSLFYFQDAEEHKDVELIGNRKLTWSQVKQKILAETQKIL